MDKQTKPRNALPTTSQSSSGSQKNIWLAQQLAILAEAFGENLTESRTEVYISDLVDLNQDQLQRAFWRARRELRFFPKIAELRELAGFGSPKEQADAEALKAWETVTNFADVWVQSDPFGKYEIDQGARLVPPPVLSAKLLSTVRRCRGWRSFKCRTAEDEPFLRKEFIEAYKIADVVADVPLERLLVAASAPVKKLTGDTQIPSAVLPPKPEPVKPKPIMADLTPDQLRDRAADQKARLEIWLAKREQASGQ